MILIKIFLIPLSFLYCLITSLRNKFYDLNFFHITKFKKPIISIGNITTGGTGKTPFTLFLAKYFIHHGLNVGIISRGYKRKTNKQIIVCDGKSINYNVNESGDELILISQNLLNEYKEKFYVIADCDRINASNFLIQNTNIDIIILDDAFQNRKIFKNLEFVLIDANEYLSNKISHTFCLPSGNLRENFGNLKRANIVVQNNKFKNYDVIDKLKNINKEIVTINYKAKGIVNYSNELLDYKNEKLILFCGIANSKSFEDYFETNNFRIKSKTIFSDHYNYIESDIENLCRIYEKGNIFVTSEKDFVKICKYENFIKNYPVYFLKIDIEITYNNENLFKHLSKILSNK